MADLSQPLVSTAAGASNPWGSAAIQGNALATFKAELRHGVAFDLGLGAYVNLDAKFQKYVAAELTGQAMAEVRVTGQVQVPLNLFEEIGLAVRLKLAAEAAAGVSLRLGLSAGELLSLVQTDLRVQGLPLKLFMIFLDEATFGGGLYAKAAASAMAYVNLVVSGRALQGPTQNETPGFNFLFEMGAGLKAGAGFRFFVNAGIGSFESLVSRSVDAVVDEVVVQILQHLPASASAEAAITRAFAAPAKIALRNAYEIGVLLGSTTQPVPVSADGAKRLALRCCQVILEESQRYLLQRIASAAVLDLQRTLEQQLASLTGVTWTTANDAVRALGQKMTQCPADPFAAASLSYWTALVPLASQALDAVSPGTPLPRKPVALLWAAMELLGICARRLTDPQARASFTLAGLNPASAQQSFQGPTVSDPGAAIRREIRGNTTTAPLRLEELIQYLVDQGIQLAVTVLPDVAVYLKIFQGPVGATVADVAAVLLSQLGPMKTDSQGSPDVKASLGALAAGLSGFLVQTVRGQLAPIVQNLAADNPDLRLYFDEVLVPSLNLTTELVFDRVLAWDTQPVDKSAFTEALSSVLVMLFGRSLTVTADILMTTAQQQMQALLLDLADHVDDVGLVRMLTPVMGGASAQEIAETMAEVLRVGADVFGPLPQETRAHIRNLLYELLEPLPLTGQAGFVDQLADNLFLPDPAGLDALSKELAGIAGQRFMQFVALLLVRIGQKVIEDLLQTLQAIQAQVQRWLADLEHLAQQILQRLADLARQIEQLAAQVAAAFADALDQLRDLIHTLSSGPGRNQLRTGLSAAVYDFIKPLLTDNLVYAALPGGVKQVARNALKGAIDAALDNAVADRVWDAIGAVAAETDDLIDRFRDIEPGANLASEVADVLVDWFVDRILDRIGTTPTIPIRFDVSWTMDVVEIDFSGVHVRTRRFEQEINLGAVRLDLGWLEPTLRDMIKGLQLFQGTVNQIATSLAHAFGLEQDLDQAQRDRDEAQDEQQHVNAQRADSQAHERSIHIETPGHATALDRDIPVSIALDGVPLSFLGLGDNEQQRVFVWLDGVPVDLDRFQVESTPDGLANRIGDIRRNAGAWGQHVLPGLRMGAPGAALKAVPATWASAPVLGAKARTRKGGRAAAVPVIPGAASGPGGLRLRMTLDIEGLDEGLHTLLVVIAEGQSRVEQTAAFLAVPPMAVKKPPVRVHVPMPGTARPPKAPRKQKARFLFERAALRQEAQGRLLRQVQAQKITPRSRILRGPA
ncbi:hypothetical protein FHP25_29970 [Vineibacter terrae]|uniref:Uncharacterized protein n=1 Tax=Vineibacter terrae TaxID=2586908 RepID=A0A5C8PDJ2_9HYPH|nr:hypothetical protein [Vineibacter terrae]TXL71458.1 hypothetical protein FHP25_29970 [Vineibacter terrae]